MVFLLEQGSLALTVDEVLQHEMVGLLLVIKQHHRREAQRTHQERQSGTCMHLKLTTAI